MLLVVHVFREDRHGEEIIRIISARAAESISSEDLANRQWSDKERRALQRARRRKVAVSVRLDPHVLEWLRSKGEGHLTRINDILTNLMEAERKAG